VNLCCRVGPFCGDSITVTVFTKFYVRAGQNEAFKRLFQNLSPSSAHIASTSISGVILALKGC
jgi:hypothetical protein